MLDLTKNTIMEWNLKGRFTTLRVRGVPLSEVAKVVAAGLIISLISVAAALMLLRL